VFLSPSQIQEEGEIILHLSTL